MLIPSKWFLILTLICFGADFVTAQITWPDRHWRQWLCWAGFSTLTFALFLGGVLCVLTWLTR